MDLNLRQQTAVDAMRRGHVAQIVKGESVWLDQEVYPSAMFDRLASMGLCVRRGEHENRIWKSRYRGKSV